MSRWLIRAAIAYAAVCAGAVILAMTGAISGIWTVVLTVPWSLWLMPLAGLSETTATLAMLGCAALNIAVLAGIGLLLGRRRAGGNA